MDQSTYWTFDIAIKLGSSTVALLGAGVALLQYRASQAQARAKLYLERRALHFTLSKQQSELFGEAASAAATLASSTNPEEIRAAIAEFWRLYWGPLLLVEGPAVEAAMVKIAACLEDFDPNAPIRSTEHRNAMAMAAYELGHACRTEVQEIANELEAGIRGLA